MTAVSSSLHGRLRQFSTLIIAIASIALLAGSCASADGSGADGSTAGGFKKSPSRSADTRSGRLSGSIIVSAAASLTEAFDELKGSFEGDHPGVSVTVNNGSSGQLASQIAAGAPVDVAALADTTPMDTLARAHLLAGPARAFAHNKLVIVTKPGNPERIKNLSDLAAVGTVAMCASSAPCGRYAERILADAGVQIDTTRITRGADAKSTLGAVAQGDADAGIVYVTDAAASGLVEAVDIPDAVNVTAEYPIAVLADSVGEQRKVAQAFVDFVLGSDGQAVLAKHGFLAA